MTFSLVTRGKDVKSLLDAGSSGWLVTQQLSDYKLELLWIAGGKGGDLSVIILDRTAVPGKWVKDEKLTVSVD